jgi:hypothetical protein
MEKIDPMKKIVQTEVPVEEVAMTKQMKLIVGGVFVVMILLGVLTGYFIAGGKKTTTSASNAAAGPTATGKNVFGSADTKTFTDSAMGTVEKEGISGEGTHKLIRDGGPSQTACLVSSVLDLDQFVGKKIKVVSKTMEAKSCPWLMDVGQVQVLE